MPISKPSVGHFTERYTLQNMVGKGAYAVVYKCVQNSTGNVYAVKVVDKSKAGPKDIDDLSHEIKVMSLIGYHPHVVQMIEYFTTPRHLYIVLDFLDGGMLFDCIVKLKHYSEQSASELIRNLLSALGHLHSKGIIHRDLKPENLLLRYSKESAPASTSYLTDVCLADFGLSGYVPSSTCCGSPSYIAPEVINVGYYQTRSQPYNAKCDIWSLGVITYILLSGKMPFHGATFKETFQKITTNRWEFAGSFWTNVSESAIDFIRRCLTQDPDKRPGAVELLQHPWVAEEQPDIHLEASLERLKSFNAQQKMRAAVRVFCWTQQLLGRHLDRTPPFMRYLKHNNMFDTVIYHQSQTDPAKVHAVDFSCALKHNQPGWRMQDCCTCASEMVCRHTQNVHEYLFVGSRAMDVYPFINELRMRRAEAEEDLAEDPNNAEAKLLLRKVDAVIEAACIFSDELAKIPPESLKPNLMLDSTRNLLFREGGGSRGTGSAGLSRDQSDENKKDEAEAAKVIAKHMKAKAEQRNKQVHVKAPATANTATPTPASSPTANGAASRNSGGRKSHDGSSQTSSKKKKEKTSSRC